MRRDREYALIISTMAKYVFSLFLVLTLLLGISGKIMAAASISQSFSVATDAKLIPGDLASTAGNGTAVVPANSTNGDRLVGVVVSPGESSLALGVDPAQSTVQVVQSGDAEVYATTLGGAIHAGDAISVSPIEGFGMRAAQGLRTIGVAQNDLSDASAGTRQLSIKNKDGTSSTVYMGAVLVSVGLGNGSAGVPSSIVGSLQSLAAVLAGHQVSTLQATLSFIIVVISVGALMALIYGAIHAGIVAIGRNPLARWSILRSVLQILGMGLLIAAVAAMALFFTLRS